RDVAGMSGFMWPAELGQAVVVNDRGQVVEAVPGRDECRFPDLSFLQLPVAEDDPGVEILARELGAERHADAGGESLAQRAGGHVQARQARQVRMPLQARIDLVGGRELVDRVMTAAGED